MVVGDRFINVRVFHRWSIIRTREDKIIKEKTILYKECDVYMKELSANVRLKHKPRTGNEA